MKNEKLDSTKAKCRTPNRRFGTMAGVTPQNVSWEIERLYPARPIVSPATAPSRHHVVRKRGDSAA